MPRSKKTDKFFLYAARKSGHWKGKQLIGVNLLYQGDVTNITLEDLIEFLKEQNINPNQVIIPPVFSTHAIK